jgi:hypothetical protein
MVKGGRMALNDDLEKPTCRPRTSHIAGNCVIVKVLVRLHQRGMQKAFVHYFTFIDKGHYHEGMFKLVKQWTKCPNADGDYVDK